MLEVDYQRYVKVQHQRQWGGQLEEEPLEENDKFMMPDFLKLTFRFHEEHEDDDFVSFIPLPPSEKDAPLF